jgi:hypothetical protein
MVANILEKPTIRSRVVQRCARTGVVVALVTFAFVRDVSAGAAPAAERDNLSGTWHISRVCVIGCVGTTTLTEVVHPYRGAVFMATGSASMVLNQLTKRKVLVHAATSSSLLTILSTGQLMRGPGVDQGGNTFVATWRCVAASAARRLSATSHPRRVWPEVAPGARVRC